MTKDLWKCEGGGWFKSFRANAWQMLCSLRCTLGVRGVRGIKQNPQGKYSKNLLIKMQKSVETPWNCLLQNPGFSTRVKCFFRLEGLKEKKVLCHRTDCSLYFLINVWFVKNNFLLFNFIRAWRGPSWELKHALYIFNKDRNVSVTGECDWHWHFTV